MNWACEQVCLPCCFSLSLLHQGRHITNFPTKFNASKTSSSILTPVLLCGAPLFTHCGFIPASSQPYSPPLRQQNLFYLEWQCGIWLLLPSSWSKVISATDWKGRPSLPLLSVSLIPREHNFISSRLCFVSHPWLRTSNTAPVIKSYSNLFFFYFFLFEPQFSSFQLWTNPSAPFSRCSKLNPADKRVNLHRLHSKCSQYRGKWLAGIKANVKN